MVRLAAALETGTRVISLDLLLLTGHDLRFGPPSCSEGDHSCLALASTVVGCHLHFVQASRVKPGQGEAVLVGWNARNGPVVRGVRDLLKRVTGVRTCFCCGVQEVFGLSPRWQGERKRTVG